MARESAPETYFGQHSTIGYKQWGDVYHPPLEKLPSQKGLIYDGDWDTIIVLDACRYDMLQVVIGNSDVVESIKPVHSPAIRTRKWLDWVWTGEQTQDPSNRIPEVTYISGSPWTDPDIYDDSRVLHNNVDLVNLANNDEIGAWSDTVDTLLPDRAMEYVIDEHTNTDKKLVHLMQPHLPFIGDILLNFGREEEGFPELSEAHFVIGDMVDKEVFRAGYYYNLIEALKAVGNYVYQAPDDEKIILTADHGEMITKLTVGHTDDVPIPWAKVGFGWDS